MCIQLRNYRSTASYFIMNIESTSFAHKCERQRNEILYAIGYPAIFSSLCCLRSLLQFYKYFVCQLAGCCNREAFVNMGPGSSVPPQHYSCRDSITDHLLQGSTKCYLCSVMLLIMSLYSPPGDHMESRPVIMRCHQPAPS